MNFSFFNLILVSVYMFPFEEHFLHHHLQAFDAFFPSSHPLNSPCFFTFSLSPCFRCRQNNNMVVMREHNQKVHLHSLHEKKSSTHQQEKKRKAKGGKREREEQTQSHRETRKGIVRNPKGRKVSTPTFTSTSFLGLFRFLPPVFFFQEKPSFSCKSELFFSPSALSFQCVFAFTSHHPIICLWPELYLPDVYLLLLLLLLDLSSHSMMMTRGFFSVKEVIERRRRRETWPTEREDSLRILICNPHEKEEIMQE